MIRGPCASHPMSALCADLESIRVCDASSCSFPEDNSNLSEVSYFCPEPVHLDSLIPRMVRLNFLISAATCAVLSVSHISDIPCTDVGCGPGGDDGLRPDGFQLTLAFTVRCHTSSSWTFTFSQVRDVCCYSVWSFCSHNVSTE
ncbi:hypothetical protein DPMN_044681 [Dreissena polymorpha]|uniref:Uncharacterized protein n=1 Tax=Dreissena polymorpha TaxID=45954 RepID=A0A9D4I0P9_DREPO|nr:hypothetical protein DPMN_044681 [Dreissena polymorpha]